MKKSLGNKRKKLGEGLSGEPDHIAELTKIYANFKQDDKRTLAAIHTNVELPKKAARDQNKEQFVSKIFANQEFSYLKMVVERPLRLNFAVTEKRIKEFTESTYFINLASSKKRKNKTTIEQEIATGEAQQQAILDVLDNLKANFSNNELIKNRAECETLLKDAFADSLVKWSTALKKALLAPNSLGKRDQEADICTDAKGNAEPDSELRDTENVPLPINMVLPLPLAYEGKADKSKLLDLVQDTCETYLNNEVLPYRPDAWIDHSKIKLGYEIPFNRHFYQYEPPRDLAEIEADIKTLEQEIMDMLGVV